MQIPHFDPVLQLPYYYPCNFPFIHEAMKRKGSESRFSLLANARMYGLPAISDTGNLRWYFSKLGYKEAIWSTTERKGLPDFEQGLKEIRARISEGELFLATGTSYFLPYCDDYMNPRYIEKHTEPGSRLYLVDHWIGVHGIYDDHLLVYDPVPAQFSGPVGREDFHGFWKGNVSIPELAEAGRREELLKYCTLEVEMEERLTPGTLKDAMRSTLATSAHEFLSGREVSEGERTFYFGHAASVRIKMNLQLAMTDAEKLQSVAVQVFDMRWSRYFLRDLLQDMAEVCGPEYASIHIEFGEIIKEWEQAHKLFRFRADKSVMNAEQLRLLDAFVNELIKREYRFYERVAALLQGVPLLGKRSAADGSPLPLPDEDMLLRIILEGCAEINATRHAKIPVELGLQAPLYGRDGNLDSLGLISLLAIIEQDILDGMGVELLLAEENALSDRSSPFRTIESLIDYIRDKLPKVLTAV
ncbi:hypothetical protein K0T92_00225 [Paenibacillus oenotherae]|uniref:Carrier domain-containing protein n=1 Tax=Paenibacillus oenotherae TaxID=1435645 RepID=A0ABS7D023_9BACL|nr:hypothetical protein [Paenibacillus oenotherae]MBW7473161.1 hypothetical protein [Paenibacillus oenotherae]